MLLNTKLILDHQFQYSLFSLPKLKPLFLKALKRYKQLPMVILESTPNRTVTSIFNFWYNKNNTESPNLIFHSTFIILLYIHSALFTFFPTSTPLFSTLLYSSWMDFIIDNCLAILSTFLWTSTFLTNFSLYYTKKSV